MRCAVDMQESESHCGACNQSVSLRLLFTFTLTAMLSTLLQRQRLAS